MMTIDELDGLFYLELKKRLKKEAPTKDNHPERHPFPLGGREGSC